VRGLDLGAAQRDDLQPLASAAARSLRIALRLRLDSAARKSSKLAIAAVEPVILDAVADQPAARSNRLGASGGDEGDVGRGQAVLHVTASARRAALRRSRRAAAARHRRERHRDLQLGIIGCPPARSQASAQPCVEHIFALAVALEIGGALDPAREAFLALLGDDQAARDSRRVAANQRPTSGLNDITPTGPR
jgi:hypothetical protein